jgi:hypothetical protein
VEIVAHHLQIQALSRASLGEKDLFGRSAFNRYYYATFLVVRAALTQIDPTWSRLPHGDYPSVLKGTVKGRIDAGRKQAQRSGDADAITLCQRANAATHELANLMSTAYASRVVADYRPEILIAFGAGGRFQLNAVDVNDAHQWPDRARIWTAEILAAWRQTNA